MSETLAAIKVELWRVLRDGGVENADWELRELVCYVTGFTAEQCVSQSGLYLSDSVIAELRELARKRAAGMPLAYLFGEWDFYGQRFFVTRDVLIPRSDTEVLCRTALDLMPDNGRVLDLCCGSGCLGLTIARCRPKASVVLADISEKALAVAEQNRKRFPLEGFVVCVRTDALQPPSPNLGRFNLIVCNPPYISADEWDCLPPSVREYEPKLALYGGEDGLDFYRVLAENWQEALRPRGVICLEVGWTQADMVCELLAKHGFRDVSARNDLQDIRRVVTARRKAT